MFKIALIIIIGALVLVASVLLFKLLQLLQKKKSPPKNNNNQQASLLLSFLIIGLAIFFWYSYTRFSQYTLPVASVHGVLMDRLFWITTVVTGIVFITTQTLLFFFSHKYRFQQKKKATYHTGNLTLEIFWTIIPTLVLTVLMFFGLKLWNTITQPPKESIKNTTVIEIVGQQFSWKARYPGKSKKLGAYDYRLIDPVNELGIDFNDENSFDNFVSNVLYLPKGKPVLFKIRSKDVLHSVYLPHFRVKMDAVPGMPTRFWFIPNKSTEDMRESLQNKNFNFELACAEICGRGHFSMKMIVKVLEPEAYETWVQSQKSFLYKNPTYLKKVPVHLQTKAKKKAGILH